MEKLKNLLKKLMHRKKISSLALISLGFFGAAYGIINYHIIISGVVYRWAANDQINAIQNFLIISLQAILLFLAINLASHKLSFAIIFLLSASAHTRIKDGGHELSTALGVPLTPTQLCIALIRGDHSTETAGVINQLL